MFKKRGRPTAATRSRDVDGEGDGEAGAVPIANKRARTSGTEETGLIGASTKRSESDMAAARADKYGDSALSGFKADDSTSAKPRDDAVRRLEVDTAVGQDTRAILERNQEIHKGLKDGSLEKGVYRGMGGYKQYAERSESAISNSKYSGQLGPTRGMSNVRSTLRIEYIGTTGEGGVCKDYKDTGYCGFGDSCKFLHDRSDYKPSYILEKEWEEKQKAIEEKKRKRWEKRLERKQAAGGNANAAASDDSSDDTTDEDSDDENLPEACPTCGRSWGDCPSGPVQTQCGHYFCEDCALETFAVSPECPACGAPTNGIFNSAEALLEKIKAKKERKLVRKKTKRAMSQRLYGHGLET